MTRDEAIELAALSVYEAGDNDPSTGGPDFVRGLYPIIVVVDESGFSELPVDDVAQTFNAINERRTQQRGRAGSTLR